LAAFQRILEGAREKMATEKKREQSAKSCDPVGRSLQSLLSHACTGIRFNSSRNSRRSGPFDCKGVVVRTAITLVNSREQAK
jgi:hypothetical protein